jgi:hypothetical protein
MTLGKNTTSDIAISKVNSEILFSKAYDLKFFNHSLKGASFAYEVLFVRNKNKIINFLIIFI